MKLDCIAAVGVVLGRTPTEADVKAVEDLLARSMREEAKADPQAWLAQPEAERVRLGAERAANELRAEAALKQRRKALQILATAKIEKAVAEFPGTPLDALKHLITFYTDRKGSVQSIESRARAVENDGLRQMITTLEATSPSFFGLIEDRAGVRDLVRELRGESTGNADAKAGAQAFRDVAEAMRQRFNRAGGDVGRLEDWGMPHHHSQLKVAKAGREAWIAAVLPRLDRSRYLNADGSRMGETALREFLGQAWATIATGGANKMEPGQFNGNGMRANRGNASREIHFKSADAYLDYQQQFGERTPYEVLISHISGLAKDIAAVEAFGPNPDHTFRLFRDRAVKAMVEADPTLLGKTEEIAQGVESQYAMVAGKTLPVANPRVAAFFAGLRNLMSASRLGAAVISALSDEGTLRVAAHVNNLPQMQLIRNELATFNPANRQEERLALRAGLAMNTMAHSINRFGNEVLGSGWTSKLSQLTLRASGLNAMTEARKRAFGVTMMSALGQVTRDHAALDALDTYDYRILLSKGVTPEEFEVWRRATPEDWGSGNNTMLTPDAIYRIPDERLADLGDPRVLREQATTRLLAHVLEETDVAVIEPGVRERAMMLEGLRRGTLKGELARSFFQFKSFPIAMVTRHWSRALAEPTTMGRAGYLAALLASTTVLGMVALQASEVTQGRDPRDMKDWRTWTSAVMKGGALSIFGDFFLSDTTQYGQSFLGSLSGPVAGLVEDVAGLTITNAHEAAQGKKTHAGAETVRFVRSNLPGANLWYTRAVIDHLLFHQLQEYLSPGYLSKMKRRARKEFGQSYWWEPGATAPKRAPDLKKAVGEH